MFISSLLHSNAFSLSSRLFIHRLAWPLHTTLVWVLLILNRWSKVVPTGFWTNPIKNMNMLVPACHSELKFEHKVIHLSLDNNSLGILAQRQTWIRLCRHRFWVVIWKINLQCHFTSLVTWYWSAFVFVRLSPIFQSEIKYVPRKQFVANIQKEWQL